ncbi:MAG: hypothetical protein PHG66_01950 [Candidatus Colwellbacteria bacterium]|nr:hypothetical protein [Candidatus Colwellbacteria bacterium]
MCHRYILIGIVFFALIWLWSSQSHPEKSIVYEGFDKEQEFNDNDPWYNRYTGEQQRGFSIETPF